MIAGGQKTRLLAFLGHHAEKLRFLLVGGWNTAFSLAALWVIEGLLPCGPRSALGAVVGTVAAKQIVLCIAWVLAVTHNLFTLKLVVFRSKGHWLHEYFRMYLTYLGAFILQSALVQALSAGFGWSLFSAGLLTLPIVTVLSYFGHKSFTFRAPLEIGELPPQEMSEEQSTKELTTQ